MDATLWHLVTSLEERSQRRVKKPELPNILITCVYIINTRNFYDSLYEQFIKLLLFFDRHYFKSDAPVFIQFICAKHETCLN